MHDKVDLFGFNNFYTLIKQSVYSNSLYVLMCTYVTRPEKTGLIYMYIIIYKI